LEARIKMELKGNQHIEASVERVWNALLDPAVLKECVPGCQELSGTVDDGFKATVVQKVGPVKATFKGSLAIEEMDMPRSLRLRGQGNGGVAGFAKGSALVSLTAEDGGTLLDYDVDSQIGGKLAQLGSRIISGFAKKMADDFFRNFKAQVEHEGSEGGSMPDMAIPEA